MNRPGALNPARVIGATLRRSSARSTIRYFFDACQVAVVCTSV